MMKYFLILVIFAEETYCESPLLKCMQPNDVDSGKYDDLKNVDHHVCTRKCESGVYKTCYYRFVVEAYSTMNGACGRCPNVTSDCYGKHCVTADGFERSILCFNRQMPGPSIQVCKNDLVIVDLKNVMLGRSTTIHWHGLRQEHSKHMDGVPMVTQCPVMEGQIFRYQFKAAYPGTHFYHSHSGLQKVDGLVGAIIIRHPKWEDPSWHEYDYDLPSHVFTIQDWAHDCADCRFPGLQTRGPTHQQEPDTYLIQGKGQFTNVTNGTSVPMAMFNVTQGKRHVFRIIAATCLSCQYTIGIEKHDMYIIAADGQPTKPYKVTSLTMSPGERYTVVVHCDKPIGSYWMHCRTLGFCRATRAYQLAIVRYHGHSGIPSSAKPGYDNVTGVNDITPTMSPVTSDCSKKSEEELGPCIADLKHARETPIQLYGEPFKTVILALGFHSFPNNTPYTNTSNTMYPKYIAPVPGGAVGSTINGYMHDSAPSPLLSQWWEVPDHVFCPEYGYDIDKWNTEVKECVHVVKVPAYCIVDIVVCDISPFGMLHPFHLHGYDMCIIEQGTFSQFGNLTTNKEKLAALQKHVHSNERKKVSRYCPNKDTVPVMQDGFVISRIYTANTGVWFFHCHFAFHQDSGMGGALVVGEPRMFPSPPNGFPRCGDFLPKLDKDCCY